MATNKSTTKNKYDSIKAVVVKSLSTKTGYTTSYIRACLIGTCKNETATEIKKQFNILYTELQSTLK